MAFDASNNKDADSTQVATSNPLSQGGSTPAAQPTGDQAQAPSQPATIQSGMSSTQAGAQQNQQSNKPASSGMFTNIQKYVQKNQPGAQKMSQAVTQNVGDQASQIAAQAQKKKEDMDKSLVANQQAMEQQKQEAAGIINQQTGIQVGGYQAPVAQPTPEMSQQPAQPVDTEAQNKRFQELMQGPTGISEVGNLNLGQQQQKAQALQNLAGQANTEMGRRQLLQDTFRKGGQEYTSGMGGLDQLIVSGDRAARENIVQGIQDQAKGLQTDINKIESDFETGRMAQEYEKGRFADLIKKMAEDPLSGLQSDLKTRLAEERAAILGKEGQQGLLTSAQNYEKQLQDRLNFLKNVYNPNLDSKNSLNIAKALTGAMKETQGNVDFFNKNYNLGISSMQDLRNKAILSPEEFQQLGLKASDLPSWAVAEGGFAYNPIASAQRGTLNQVGNLLKQGKYNADPILDELKAQGLDYQSLQNALSDEGLSGLSSIATDQEFQNYNKLQNLLGNQSILPEESRSKVISSEALKNILNKYNVLPNTSSTQSAKRTGSV